MLQNYGYQNPQMFGQQIPIQGSMQYDPNMYYQNRMNFLQNQMQQNNQQNFNMLGGKVVDSVEVVKATDIPMDGNSYYFPNADGSEVYSKRWLPNGKTEIVVYTKQNPITESKEVKETNELMEKLNGFDERFDKLEKLFSAKQVGNKNKKEDVVND